jgi:precorrin-4/cobalt-precorrin-4 C11-methyltransferase
MRSVAVLVAAAALVSVSCAFAADATGPQVLPGKFYIVGMGTCPDLMTVRAARVCERTDIFLLEEPGDAVAWKAIIKDRPVIYCPHTSRVYYGADISKIEDPTARAVAERNDKSRKDIIRQIVDATKEGKTVSSLQWGDPMVYGTTFYLEMLPPTVDTEIVPGLGAFEAGSAAIKWSPTFGGDTNGVILTMGDWPERTDTNDKLFALKTSVVIYTCGWKFKEGFEQLRKYYPPETPVAVVCYAGVPNQEAVLRGTVGDFIEKVDCDKLPYLTIVFVGKFIGHGQARNDFVASGKDFVKMIHDSGEDHSEGAKVDEPEAKAIGLRTECATPIK